MFEFTKKFGVNDKLTFRLYPELVAESYTLLVKKIKDNLVAAVVSNNDKNSVDPKINDEIFLYSEAGGGNWVTKTLVMQTNAYPLIILSIAEEPRAITPAPPIKPHALLGDIESAEHALPPAIGVGKGNVASGKFAVKSDDDDLTTMPSITIRELTAEHDRAQGQEGIRFGADELDTLPDIDTSDLEAELDADIEDTLQQRLRSFAAEPEVKSEEPPPEPSVSESAIEPEEEEDDISDMTIVKDRDMEIGDFEDDDDAPAVEKQAEQESLELDIDEPQEAPVELDEEPVYAAEADSEVETTSAPESFHDFFTAYLTPLGNDGSALYEGFDADVPLEVKVSLDALAKRIEKLEGALSSISGRPTEPVEKPAVRSAVIIAELTEDGFKAVMDPAPSGGGLFTVEIDRPWKPSLFLKATAVAESSYNVNGVTLARFRFEDIDDEGLMAVRTYLEGRAGYYKTLTDLIEG